MLETHQTLPSGDADDVTRCLQGDLAGFDALVRRHGGRLKRLLNAMLSESFDVEDVYQETLLRAYLNLDQLRDPDRFKAWIFSIAFNLARTVRRRNSSSKIVPLAALIGELPDEPGWPDHSVRAAESGLVEQEEALRIHQAVADLPPAEREAVMLVYLGGMSHKEVAAQLGASLSAVKVRVHRGRRRLRRVFIDQAVTAPIMPVQEVEMVEVKIVDIVMSESETVPESATKVSPVELRQMLARLDQSRRYVVLLKEVDGERALPIWIGAFSAEAIAIASKQAKLPRPLTFDLMKSLLELGKVNIERVEIHQLHEGTYFANMVVKTEQESAQIDCRPSDAINLAVRLGVQILVSNGIMDQHACTAAEDGTYAVSPDHPEFVWESILAE